ncbi:MAG TPA: LCP family protein [Candidatus Limnocylindrales bacterium]|nr:LCP family protein [Candidatus Limnocylindrales bacterium]
MHREQEPRPRAKSPFVAAFLSLLFPGLGHAYAGAYQRALGFAAPPILLAALAAGIALRAGGTGLITFLLTPWVVPGIFVLNLVLLIYRLVAIVDAYRVTVWLNALAANGGGRLGRPRLAFSALSLAGLLAVIFVMSGAHVVVARYDLQASDFLNDPCVFITSATPDTCDQASPSSSGSTSPNASGEPTAEPIDSPSPTPTPPPNQGSDLPDASIPPWDGTDRLNILLIGSDQRPNEGTYNTDTLIVVSIDPTTKQVAMFSLPRDSWGIPLPAGRLRNAFGSTYEAKINSFFTAVRGRPDLVAGTSRTRGYNGLKQVLGNLYNLDIKYFVEVNFEGFRKVVDAMGGVTINVQVPVLDDSYPSDTGRSSRVYIPAGIQHMTGSQALVYARSRHGSDDFDRGARQQRVLTSLREQADVAALIPRIPQLLAAVKATVRTDIPQDQLAKLAGLASMVDTKNIRSFVFSFPRFGSQVLAPIYKYLPNVSKIRSAVANAFKVDPQLENTRSAMAEENGSIWVLNGSGIPARGPSLAGYLAYYGLNASAPTTKPSTSGITSTQIVVYNGAESRLTDTIAFLQTTFGSQVILKNDPAIPVDIVITTTSQTPNKTAPPTS